MSSSSPSSSSNISWPISHSNIGHPSSSRSMAYSSSANSSTRRMTCSGIGNSFQIYPWILLPDSSDMNQYPLLLFDGLSAIAPTLRCSDVLVVPMYTSQYAPNVTFSRRQSGLFRPRTIIAGLSVRDMPSLCGKSLRHDVMSITFSSTISFGAFRYGSDTQQQRTRSFNVLIPRSIPGMCCLAAHMLTCTSSLFSSFRNSLSPCIALMVKPLVTYI